MSRAPLIPAALTTGPFNREEARRYGLTKDHLLGASWRRLGGGYYAFRAIAHDTDVVLAVASRRLPMNAAFSGRTAAWLHGLDLPPCDPVEATLPLGSHTSRLARIAVRRSDVSASERVTRRGYPTTSVVRTLADLGRRRPLVEAVAALDMALHKRLLKSTALHSWACEHPRYPGFGRRLGKLDRSAQARYALRHADGRRLYVDDARRMPMDNQYVFHDDTLTTSVVISRADVAGRSRKLALDTASDIFGHFGWFPDRALLQGQQDELRW